MAKLIQLYLHIYSISQSTYVLVYRRRQTGSAVVARQTQPDACTQAELNAVDVGMGNWRGAFMWTTRLSSAVVAMVTSASCKRFIYLCKFLFNVVKPMETLIPEFFFSSPQNTAILRCSFNAGLKIVHRITLILHLHWYSNTPPWMVRYWSTQTVYQIK